MTQAILNRIKELEDSLKKTQYNKATEHHFGVVKAQIAKLREKIEVQAAKGKKGEGFFVKKTGDATVVLLGFPSVGKSTLLNVLTNAKSATGAYQFTTLTVIPGLLEYKQAKIQILDVPGVVEGAASGRGRGKEVLAMVRSCDLILIVIDAQNPEQTDALYRELYAVNVRVDQEKPDVKIVKKPQGGIRVATTVALTKLSRDTIASVLREFKINNADVVIRSDIDVDQLIDAIAISTMDFGQI